MIEKTLRIIFTCIIFLCPHRYSEAQQIVQNSRKILILDGKFPILPGSATYLRRATREADVAAVVLLLDTPGGALNTTQEMVGDIFSSPVPVIVFVTPTGGAAISAGVFITMAGHIAAMSPGTSIGAAHPVTGAGQDLQGDLRDKATNIASSLAKSIAEQRGRDAAWAEEAVKKSSSLTEKEALQRKVIDIVAADVDSLLTQVNGKIVRLGQREIALEDFTKLERKIYPMSMTETALNVLCDPNVAAMLWLVASAALTLEFYNPGLIIPGIVGVIALVLGLMVNQVLPVNDAAILLIVAGVFMIVSEVYFTSGILALGGALAITMGLFWFIDSDLLFGIELHQQAFLILAVVFALVSLWVARVLSQARKKPLMLDMAGRQGVALEAIGLEEGRVEVQGEIWNAKSVEGIISKNDPIVVVRKLEGLRLEVKSALKK